MDALDESLRRSGNGIPARTSWSPGIILEGSITHDLYTATTRVSLHPESEMKRGVESTMKSLPSSFTCKAVYVSILHSNDLSPFKDYFHFSLTPNNVIPCLVSTTLAHPRRNNLLAYSPVRRELALGMVGMYFWFIV